MSGEPIVSTDQRLKKEKVLPKQPYVFLAAGLLLGWAVDFLFWGVMPGITIAIWIVLTLAALLGVAKIEHVKPAPFSIVLIIFILLAAVFTVVRLEPLTLFANTCAALFGLVLLAATFRDGFWPFYRLVDYILPLLGTVFGGLARPFCMISGTANGTADPEQRHSKGRTVLAVLRGLVIVIPILLVLGGLLASADPIFKEQLGTLINWFSIERLPEYIFRMIFVLIYTVLFTGILLQALLPEKEQQKPDPARPLFQPFLGWIETVIIFAGINLMFLLFVIIQANYLFGGYQNIRIDGYTYAEYARNGFGELILVAILSLGIYLVLAAVSRREEEPRKRWFSGFTVMLFLQVLIMLFSSFQRLTLYETAYGFTRLRMYTHVFIICLAVLLLVMMVLDLLRSKGHFGLVFLLFCYVFSFSLGATNVDGLITQKNIAQSTWHVTNDTGSRVLDYDYLRSLSNDATLQLIKSYANEDLPLNTHEKIGAILACRNYAFGEVAPFHWRSYQPVTAIAGLRLADMAAELEESYRVLEKDDGVFVKYGNHEWQCDARWEEMD